MTKLKKYLLNGALAAGMLALLASALETRVLAGVPGGCGSTCKTNSDCTGNCPGCFFDTHDASGTCK